MLNTFSVLPLRICHLAFFFLPPFPSPPAPPLSEGYKLKENKTTSLGFMGFNSCQARLLVFLLQREIALELTFAEHRLKAAESGRRVRGGPMMQGRRDALLALSVQSESKRCPSEQLSAPQGKNKK